MKENCDRITTLKKRQSSAERGKRSLMKITNIRDIEEFFSVVDDCAGLVWLVTGEGDRLNLKSKLSQYVSLANIFTGEADNTIPELEIMVSDPEDMKKLMRFAE